MLAWSRLCATSYKSSYVRWHTLLLFLRHSSCGLYGADRAISAIVKHSYRISIVVQLWTAQCVFTSICTYYIIVSAYTYGRCACSMVTGGSSSGVHQFESLIFYSCVYRTTCELLTESTTIALANRLVTVLFASLMCAYHTSEN